MNVLHYVVVHHHHYGIGLLEVGMMVEVGMMAWVLGWMMGWSLPSKLDPSCRRGCACSVRVCQGGNIL